MQNTKITNRTTTVIPLIVDTESVMLGDRRGKKYPAINPYQHSNIVEYINVEIVKIGNRYNQQYMEEYSLFKKSLKILNDEKKIKI